MFHRYFLPLVLLVCCSCTQYGQLQLLARLPGNLNEVSGIATYNGKTFWIIEDGSNPDRIREIDTTGTILREYEVKGAKNKDWEAITLDRAGNLYIGDFGNNANDRDDLAIYRLADPRKEPGDKIDSEAIRFSYPDQDAFPPDRNAYLFDAESFFHHGDSLYIITKNRSRPFDGTAGIYRLPDRPGTYEAEKLARIRLCGDRRICQVTDAALSPSGRRLVLLGYGYLWVYDNFWQTGFSGTPRRLSLATNTQLEGVCFAGEERLYLIDERSLGRGGNLYTFELPLN